MISIIVPTLNEESRIATTLEALQRLPGRKEIIVADGQSDDRTAAIAAGLGVQVVSCERGRGSQLRAGAVQAAGDVLWFVHADTHPDPAALSAILASMEQSGVAGGNFALVFAGEHDSAVQMTAIYPYLRWLGLSYGDAGIFIRKSVYHAMGGFRPYPLFEDLDLVQRMKRYGQFVHLTTPIFTSSRRFSGSRYPRVWLLWIALQIFYWLGVSPYRLARWYRLAR